MKNSLKNTVYVVYLILNIRRLVNERQKQSYRQQNASVVASLHTLETDRLIVKYSDSFEHTFLHQTGHNWPTQLTEELSSVGPIFGCDHVSIVVDQVAGPIISSAVCALLVSFAAGRDVLEESLKSGMLELKTYDRSRCLFFLSS